MQIKKVAVIGSGVMGAGIAAHLANAGIPSVLLDIVPKFTDEDSKAGLKETDKIFRSKLARRSIDDYARRQGYTEVSAQVMDEARGKMGM